MAEKKDNHIESLTNADGATQEELNKLDAVRDLLFGQNVKEYRQEIRELKQELDKSDSQLSKRLDDLSSKLEDRLKEIEGQLKVLAEDKVDRNSLAEAFSSLAKSIQK